MSETRSAFNTVGFGGLDVKLFRWLLSEADFLKWDHSAGKFDTIISCMVVYLVPDLEGFINKIPLLLSENGRAYLDILTCGGTSDQRQLDDYVLRTKTYINKIIKASGLKIVSEKIGPNQFAVGTYLELSLS